MNAYLSAIARRNAPERDATGRYTSDRTLRRKLVLAEMRNDVSTLSKPERVAARERAKSGRRLRDEGRVG